MAAEQAAEPSPPPAEPPAPPLAAAGAPALAAGAAAQPPQPAARIMQAAAPSKRRKNAGKGRAGGSGGASTQEELVRLGHEVARTSERLRTGWHPVQLSSEDKAADVELDAAHLTASSRAGYRMVRATHGACAGTWYFEVRIDHLGKTGAARVGWATRQAELNAPVGSDEHGLSYRSTEGSKVHKAWRDSYGQPYGEGDVIGCLLHLPEGGRPFEQTAEEVVQYRGKLFFQEGEAAKPQPLPGACVAFARNGVLQGKAFEDLKEGTYYPALSLYSNRQLQPEPVKATVNFGERGFAFPPPAVEGCLPPRPACELSGPQPTAKGKQEKAAQQGQQPASQGAAEGQQPAAQGAANGQQPAADREQQRRQQGEATEQQQAGGDAAMETD
ncbi:hypothetical protein ABPG75_001640 [Micractinium tetrahymenae]